MPYARRKVLLTAALAAAIVLHAGKLIKPAALPTSDGATLVQANIPILDSGAWTLDYLTQTLDSLAALSAPPEHNKAGTPGLDSLAGIASAIFYHRPAPSQHLGQ